MSQYTHVLLATDTSEESARVADQAGALARSFGARLSVVHVIEPLTYAYGGDLPLDFSSLQQEIQKQAEQHLARLGEQHGIAASDRHLVVGRPAEEIHRLARQLGADLIIVGSHGRHGLALLLGSTASGVLHGAPCDVLAVRIGN